MGNVTDQVIEAEGRETPSSNLEKNIPHTLIKVSALLSCPACVSNQRGWPTPWGSGEGLLQHSNLIQASRTVPSIDKSRQREKRKARFLATANATPCASPAFHLTPHPCSAYSVKMSCANCNSPPTPSLPTRAHSRVESLFFMNWKAG